MSATTLPSGRTAAARRATSRHAVPRRERAPLPRRLSGPVAGRERGLPAHHGATVTARALAVVRSLPEHSLIDRLVRGRAWIPVLGVLLAGIVTMQVEILKLGTSLGRSLQRTTALQSKNESLQASIAALGDNQRIERLAVGMGMVTPSAGLLTFIGAHPQHQLSAALANIHAPDPSGFAAQLAAQAATASLMSAATTASNQSGTSQLPTGSTPGVPGSSGTAQSGVAQTGTGTTSQSQTGTGQASSAQSATSQTSSGATGTSSAASTGTTSTGTGSAGANTSTGANATTGAAAPSTTASSQTAAVGSTGAAALPTTGSTGG